MEYNEQQKIFEDKEKEFEKQVKNLKHKQKLEKDALQNKIDNIKDKFQRERNNKTDEINNFYKKRVHLLDKKQKEECESYERKMKGGKNHLKERVIYEEKIKNDNKSIYIYNLFRIAKC